VIFFGLNHEADQNYEKAQKDILKWFLDPIPEEKIKFYSKEYIIN
jgi:hypothetical protein